VVDCDDQVGAGVDGLAQRLGQFVRADPVFGDGSSSLTASSAAW